MRFESEVVANQILPAIRSILADRLHSEYGMTQEEIAERLDVTQPAVSQYINQSRADQEVVKKMQGDPQVKLIMEDTASLAARNEDFIQEIRNAVKTIQDKGLFSEKFEDTKKL